MDQTLYIDAARCVHLVGLAIGFGLALWADVSALRSLIRPLTAGDIAALKRLHMAVTFGLVLLWSSGIVLLHARTGLVIENFTPKLMMKLGVVSLLTLNAYAIGAFALPRLENAKGVRFSDLELTMRFELACVAGLSFSYWISALALGVFSQLKPMPLDGLQQILGGIFLLGIGGACFIALIAPSAVWILDRAARTLMPTPRA